jgi:hypothetical protein
MNALEDKRCPFSFKATLDIYIFVWPLFSGNKMSKMKPQTAIHHNSMGCNIFQKKCKQLN